MYTNPNHGASWCRASFMRLGQKLWSESFFITQCDHGSYRPNYRKPVGPSDYSSSDRLLDDVCADLVQEDWVVRDHHSGHAEAGLGFRIYKSTGRGPHSQDQGKIGHHSRHREGLRSAHHSCCRRAAGMLEELPISCGGMLELYDTMAVLGIWGPQYR